LHTRHERPTISPNTPGASLRRARPMTDTEEAALRRRRLALGGAIARKRA
jgi:hypothetical protein